MFDERRLFVTLAEAGSFARAARQLGVSRSTVMRRLDALEEELGVTLVQRASRRLALTEAGLRYAAELRPVLHQLTRVEQELRQEAGQLSGSLRLWLPLLGTGAFISHGVAAFREAHPGVLVRMELGRDIRALRVGDFDVALQVGLRLNPGLQARTMYQERMIIVASPGYLARFGRPEALDALSAHRAVHQHDLEGRLVPWRLPDGARAPMPPPAVVVNAVGVAFELALEGAGLTRVPRALAAPALADGRLEQVLPEVCTQDPVSFVFPPDPTPVTRAFVAFMTALWRAGLGEGAEQVGR